jgi:transposase-like protein
MARGLVDRARVQGVDLVGLGGLLSGLTMQVLEMALEAELEDYLGYPHGDREVKPTGNQRNGTRSKTVQTEIGPVEFDVPWDRDATFAPVIVKKRQRRLTGVDEMVLSLTVRGLTGGEGAKYWLAVLTEIKNRGVQDVLITVCDGLKGAARGDQRGLGAGRGAHLCDPPAPQ